MTQGLYDDIITLYLYKSYVFYFHKSLKDKKWVVSVEFMKNVRKRGMLHVSHNEKGKKYERKNGEEA